MNRKTVFFFLLALAAGALAGYAVKSLFCPLTGADAKPSGEQGLSRPRFGEALPGASRASSLRDTAHSGPSGERRKLDDSLKQYYRMGAEELRGELAKFRKQGAWGYYLDTTEQAILLAYIFTRLGEDAPRQTLVYLDERKELQTYMEDVLAAWGRKNPEAAMAYCREKMEEGSDNKRLWRRKYIELFSDRSPEEALDYVLTNHLTEEGAMLIREPLSRLSAQTPEKRQEILEKLKPVMNRNGIYDYFIVNMLAKSGWDTAEEWIRTQPEARRAEILTVALFELPRDEAEEKWKTLDLDEKAKMRVLAELGNGISSKESPVKALEFIQNNATEEQAAEIVEKTFFSLDGLDSELSAYLGGMPAGALKDSVLKRVTESFGGAEFRFLGRKTEEALSLIDQMSSSEKKEEATDSVLNNWRNEDPQAAKSWVEQSSLTEDKKKEFIRRCDDALKPAQDGE